MEKIVTELLESHIDSTRVKLAGTGKITEINVSSQMMNDLLAEGHQLLPPPLDPGVKIKGILVTIDPAINGREITVNTDQKFRSDLVESELQSMKCSMNDQRHEP